MSNESKKPAAKPDGNRTGAMRSWIIIATVVALFFAFYKTNPGEQAVRELTQIEFYKALDEGKLVEPVVRFIDRDEGETYLTGEMETDQVDKDGKPLADKNGDPVRVRYRVPLVPGENESLMENLFSQQIPVKVKERRSPLSPLVMNILFFGGMMFLFYWLFYRKMGGDGGMFGFGKSRAKLLDGKAEKAKVTFSDVAGIDEAKEEVQEIVSFLKEPAAFRKLGGRIPKGVLLVGPPGTGKTLLAKAIAGEAQVPFFAISGSDFEEMFVGVGASRYNEQTLNTMLVEMDGFSPNEGVIVIAATNRPDTLDAALLRPGRFDRQVMIDLPTLKGREEILALHGKKIKFGPDADLSRIARGTPGFSGADLANLLNEAALMSVRKKLDGVDMETLEEARDKVLWGRERKSAGYSQKDREITAWHEAGHAILQLLAKNADPLHKVTIIPRGRALGATMSLPEKDVLNRTKNYFLDEMVVCCGGRIAEEIFTGDISTGAAQDIAQATEIARDMVCRYGMSGRFGFQAFAEQSRWTTDPLPPTLSEHTRRALDDEVSRLVDEAYERAEKLLKRNRDRLELIAKTLIEKETMDGAEVRAIAGIDESKPEEAEDEVK